MIRTFVVGLLLTASMTGFAQQNKDTVVAVIGNKRVTLEDFNRRYNEVRSQAINPPTREQFLEDVIRYELGLQEADKRKLAQDPVVQERMRQEVYKALIERDLDESVKKISVSDKEMEEYYRRNPEIRSSHILIELKTGATPEQKNEARARAQKIFEEVKVSKRPFEELVRLYSDDPITKQTGGDVGFQSRVSLVPSYWDTISAMKVGEIRGLIETPFGFHIVKVTARRSYENSNKRQLRMSVFEEKRRRLFDDYFAKLRKNYKVESNPQAVRQ